MNGKIANTYNTLSSTSWNKVQNPVHSGRIRYEIPYKCTHVAGIRYGIGRVY